MMVAYPETFYFEPPPVAGAWWWKPFPRVRHVDVGLTHPLGQRLHHATELVGHPAHRAVLTTQLRTQGAHPMTAAPVSP